MVLDRSVVYSEQLRKLIQVIRSCPYRIQVSALCFLRLCSLPKETREADGILRRRFCFRSYSHCKLRYECLTTTIAIVELLKHFSKSPFTTILIVVLELIKESDINYSRISCSFEFMTSVESLYPMDQILLRGRKVVFRARSKLHKISGTT